jgi:hypothetical protein
MSILADEFRLLWLRDIHKVEGIPTRSLVGLLAQQDYQIYSPINKTSAELSFSDWGTVAEAFAYDSARMSMAAIETMQSISQIRALPKSMSWVAIKSYYGAFYAAHALGRMLGLSMTQLDAAATEAVDKIAQLYGAASGISLDHGYYKIHADYSSKRISLKKIKLGKGGIHAAFWLDFAGVLRSSGNNFLSAGSVSAQIAVDKLIALEDVLTNRGSFPKGNWLSEVRNRVNYQHSYGTWFPYRERPTYFDKLLDRTDAWRKNPDEIKIWDQQDRELERFIECCALLVSLCRETCFDMARCSPNGKSFHKYTSISLLERIEAREPK